MASYQQIIIQAILFFPIIAFIFSLPYIIYNYHKYGSFLSMRIAIVYSFILYLICTYFLVILPLPSMEYVATLTTPRTQLIPFQFINDIFATVSITFNDPMTYLTALNTPALYQAIFNLAMTIPFGMYLHYYFKCSFKKTILLSFLLSLFFEFTQLSGLYFIYPRSYRLFDVDDLIINTLGGMLGYAVIIPFMKVLPTREEIDKASYQRGLTVSLPRRLLAFILDMVLILILDSLINWGLQSQHLYFEHTLSCITLLYFIIITIASKGFTFGKKATNTRIVNVTEAKIKWYQYIIRYLSLYLIIDILPLTLSEWVKHFYEHNQLHLNAYMLISGLILSIVIIYLLFAAVEIAAHKRLFYERLSKTKIISTIAAESEEPQQEKTDQEGIESVKRNEEDPPHELATDQNEIVKDGENNE